MGLDVKHIHLVIGSTVQPLSDIISDLKKYSSVKLIEAIKGNKSESRKQLMVSIFESAGRVIAIINGINFGYKTIADRT